MHPLRIHGPPILAAVLFPALLASTVFAQSSGPSRRGPEPVTNPTPRPPTPPATALDRSPSELGALLLDAPGDGSIWARGSSYKVGFDADGATFYPAFGPNAPKNFPHRLSPVAAGVGGLSLAIDAHARPSREGERVRYERGSFVELYDLSSDSLEQSFVFDALPERGELSLRIEVASELEAFSDAAGIGFRNAFGEVRYGRATAIDAHGARCDAPTALVVGAIEIRVPADFIARAALPLVVDPVVQGVPIDTTTADTFSPDLAWEPFQQGWLAVYEQTFSATDTDVLAKFLNPAGTAFLVGSVDISTARWDFPRCANLAAAHQFLVVSAVTSGTTQLVRGRTVQPNGTLLTMSSQFDVSDASTGDKVQPDVGGDPFQFMPSFYCVTYAQKFHGESRIALRLVRPDATLVGSGPTYLTPGGSSFDSTPSVSNSNGTSEWLIAWTRNDPLFLHDIYAARINWDGAINAGAFGVTGGNFSDDAAPCASTRLETSGRSAIAFERAQSGGTSDIMVSLLSNSGVLQTANLHTLEGTGTIARKQSQPSIDSNGAHFLVAYSEVPPGFLNEDSFVTDLFAAESELGVSQAHTTLQMWGLPQLHSRVGAQHGTGSPSHRFLVLYDVTENSVDHDVAGQLYDVFDGGSASAFCAGDNSGLACPCGNPGAAGHGCANSANAAGGLLAFGGTPSTLADSALLSGSGLPNNATCLFFQGTVANSGSVFGDGVRCTGGSVIRLAVKVATGGVTSFPQGSDPDLSVGGQLPLDGGLRTYQLWYRDTANFCTSANFNITNGLRVLWAR